MDSMKTDFYPKKNKFYFVNDYLESLFFVLDCDSKEKFYLNFLNNLRADVVDTPNDHSMVLAVPRTTKYFHPKIPAFDIKYIEDCFKIKDFPDPTKYLIKKTSSANYTKDQIFDCWLHQTISWDDLMPIPKTRKNTRNSYSHKEDTSIVKCIIKNKWAFSITGVLIWKRMEHDNVCEYRTWQSMKERYLKRIKRDLNSKNHSFPFLTCKQLEILRNGLNKGK